MNQLIALTLCALLAGCAADSSRLTTAEADRYRCENDVAFTVKFANDSAVVNSNRGYEVLYRTAGGLTPGQTVYSNPRMRAEFGLGANGKEAVLRYLLQPVVVRCARD
jgi:hypothetical protein